MEIILDNIAAILTLLGTVLVAGGIFRSEIRRFTKRSSRDIAFTMSRAELENVLNKSFEISYQLAELTEIRIHNQWEIRMLRRDLFDSQKTKIRQLSGNLDVKLKTAFAEKLPDEPAITSIQDRTILYQQFSNALAVVSTSLRMKIYDLCADTDLVFKEGQEWEAWVRQTRTTLSLEAIDHLRAVFLTTPDLKTLPGFLQDSVSIIEEFVDYGLSFAKAEAILHKGKVEQLEKEIRETVDKLRELKERKSLDLVHTFVEPDKAST